MPKGLRTLHRQGRSDYYWVPDSDLVKAGFRPRTVRLSGTLDEMVAVCERMNREAAAFKEHVATDDVAILARQKLDYDPETGVFKRRSTQKVATRPGTKGYLYVSLAGTRYSAHHLAWIYVYGEVPTAEPDHIDRNRANNAIANLRMANRSENNANRDPRSSSTTGYKGLMRRPGGRWSARVTKDGVHHNLGVYDSKYEAARAYDRKAREVFGEFARLNFPNDALSKERDAILRAIEIADEETLRAVREALDTIKENRFEEQAGNSPNNRLEICQKLA